MRGSHVRVNGRDAARSAVPRSAIPRLGANGRGIGRRWPIWLVFALVAAYTIGLVLHGDGPNPLVDIWLGELTQWAPVALFWVATVRTGFARGDVLFATLAVTLNAAADTYYVTAMDAGGELPFPSLADVGYLLFYPLMLAALVALVRSQMRGLAWSVLLDSAVGAIGSAAILTALLAPVLTSAVDESEVLATAVAVAYPVFDLLLVAAVAGIAWRSNDPRAYNPPGRVVHGVSRERRQGQQEE